MPGFLRVVCVTDEQGCEKCVGFSIPWAYIPRVQCATLDFARTAFVSAPKPSYSRRMSVRDSIAFSTTGLGARGRGFHTGIIGLVNGIQC